MAITARCTACGTTLPANARFCSTCGADNAAPALKATGATAMPVATGSVGAPESADDGRRKIALAIGGGLAAVAIAGAIFAGAFGLLGAKKTETQATGVLSAPPTQTVQAPVLTPPTVEAPPSAPVIAPPTAQGNPMPEDVIAYLRWLKQFEAGRRALEAKGQSELMIVFQEMLKTTLTGPASMNLLDGDPEGASNAQANGGAPAKKTFDMGPINKVIQDWNQASGIFQQKTPPNPCATLAGTYNKGLVTSVQQMSQLTSILGQAMQSLSASGGEMTGDAQGTLNNLFQQKNSKQLSQSVDALIVQSDTDLNAVRAQYTNIPPDIDQSQFNIKSESSGFKLPGMGL